MIVNPRPRSELVEMLLETRKERDELKARVKVLEAVMLELEKDRKPPPFHEGIDMLAAVEKPARADTTIARLTARAAELERRLGNYECPEHEKPDYECEKCLGHLRDAGALEEEPPER